MSLVMFPKPLMARTDEHGPCAVLGVDIDSKDEDSIEWAFVVSSAGRLDWEQVADIRIHDTSTSPILPPPDAQ